MKNLILFDIDDTIINTILYRKIQDETLAKYLNIDDLEIKKNRSDYYHQLIKGSDFSVDEYLQILANKYHHNLADLKKVFLNPTNIQLCLYDDVVSTFTELKNNEFLIGTFSEGFESFQKFKLEMNNLLIFFEQAYVYLLRKKLDKNILSNLPAGTIIVDNKPEVITELQTYKNIRPIQIIRENEKENPIVGETVINNLNQLLAILL